MPIVGVLLLRELDQFDNGSVGSLDDEDVQILVIEVGFHLDGQVSTAPAHMNLWGAADRYELISIGCTGGP